jgi:bifunctional DNA-binding transcriptional regulator/antitoxin component of YhaV-PrlF toxin-antitoxin module
MSPHVSSPVRRPSRGTKTERIWAIAEEITRRTGRKAARSAVVKQATAEGYNAGTASTQYNEWSRNYRGAMEADGPAGGGTLGPIALQVKEAGRIVLTAELRTAMGIKEGDTVLAQVEKGELRLFRRDDAIRRLQAKARALVPSGTLVSEELIADRRKEAARE